MTVNVDRLTAPLSVGIFKWVFHGLFLDFSFLFLDSLIQLIYLQCSNDRRQERRRKYVPFYDPLFRDSPPGENTFIAFPKKPSSSRDSNPARSDRMLLLYHLRHYHSQRPNELLDIYKLRTNRLEPQMSSIGYHSGFDSALAFLKAGTGLK